MELTKEMLHEEDMRRWCLEDAQKMVQRAYLARHGKPYISPSGNRFDLHPVTYANDKIVDEACKRLLLGSHSGRIGDGSVQ